MKLIYFFTFAPMKINRIFAFSPDQIDVRSNAYKHLLQVLCVVKSILVFDIFQYSNTYQEKLPIIYANIRV